jgi:hypothetical protein
VNIKKQTQFAFRYLPTSHRWYNRLIFRILIVFTVSAISFGALVWFTPRPVNGAYNQLHLLSATQALTKTSSLLPTKTPFPDEYLNNSQQTNGITITGAVLVLIVVTGVMVFMPKSRKK